MFFVPEMPIGEIAVQYRETDWRQQGVVVGDDNFLVIETKTDDISELFEQVEEAGQTLSVREISHRLEKGLLNSYCLLQKKEGILQKKEFPMHLIGVALEGTVAAVSGIRLKVHLKIDGGKADDVYWFPFSTLSASPDGSGWYYMPEPGDQIRVYFPTKYTRDVTAVSAVSAYDGKSGGKPDRMGSPSTKYLSNPSGQEIKLGEDGVNLSCSGGAASVTIGNGGDISLHAANTLHINATNNIELNAETEMVLQAAQTALVACAMGGRIQMQPGGELWIQGSEVKVD